MEGAGGGKTYGSIEAMSKKPSRSRKHVLTEFADFIFLAATFFTLQVLVAAVLVLAAVAATIAIVSAASHIKSQSLWGADRSASFSSRIQNHGGLQTTFFFLGL